MPWIRLSQSLRFTAGDFCLFNAGLTAAVNSSVEYLFHPQLLTNELLQQRLTTDVDAVVVRAHPVSEEIPRVTVLPKMIRYVSVEYERCFVTFAGTFEEYKAKFSSKSRKNLNRSIRDFSEWAGGQTAVRVARTPAEMVEFHRAARAISLKTYQERLVGQGLPDTPHFHQEMASLAEQNRARGYLLCGREAPVAFAYCSADGDDGLYYHTIGYEAGLAKYSPGNVLLLNLIENMFEERHFAWLDFGESADPYKLFFSNHRLRCARVYYFRRSLYWLVVIWAHILWSGGWTAFGAFLKSIGFKNKLKKLFRIWATRRVELT
jgi:CelD/BcsL family acetyltransferase involved in cellulose biosynthesis